jgi:hypothetical protein
VVTASNAIEPTTVADMGRARVASLLAAASLVATAAAPGHALALSRGYGLGPGYCGQLGSWASPYSFEGVYACGGVASFGPTPFDANHEESFQCVELSARFLWVAYGIWAGPGMGIRTGASLVAVVHSQHPWIRVGYATPGSVPVAGDVVSLGPGGAVGGVFGHTGIVISDDQRHGRFRIIGQNFPPGHAGEQVLQVDFNGRHNGDALLHGVWTPASWLELRPRPKPKLKRHRPKRHAPRHHPPATPPAAPTTPAPAPPTTPGAPAGTP